MLPMLLLRDLAIGVVAVLAWRWAAPFSAGPGVVGDLSGVLLGLLLGACAFLAHEWGHLLGGFLSRSKMTLTQNLASPSLFTYDSRANSRGQFLVMSFAGFAATGVAIYVAYWVLPSELLATRVARGVVAFLTLLGVVLELPLVAYSLVSRKVPPLDRKQPEPVRAAA